MDGITVIASSDTSGPGSNWGMRDPPRIRSITGVRIRQLTLPESLHLASKLQPSPLLNNSSSVPEDGYFLGESSHLSSSPGVSTATLRRTESSASRRSRRISLSELGDTTGRARAGSSSTLGVTPSFNGDAKERVTRPRSKTLAGEALDHERERSQTNDIDNVLETEEGENEGGGIQERRSLARCFIAFRLQETITAVDSGNGDKTENKDVKGKGRAETTDSIPSPRRHPSIINTRPSRSSSLVHPSSPTTPTGHESPESSRPNTPNRIRTTSLNTIASPTASKTQPNGGSPTSDSVQRLGQRPPRLVRAGSDVKLRPIRPVSMISRASYRSPHLNGVSEPKSQGVSAENGESKPIPFFLSAIHPPSSHPTFPSLLPASDFASWLSAAELAAQEILVEVWYEDLDLGWSIIPGLGGLLDLRALEPVQKDDLSPNSLQISLKGDKENWYSIPTSVSSEKHSMDGDIVQTRKRGASVRGVLERSVRETRMKKGVSVGTLHQFVHDQSVVADIKENIEVVQTKINTLLDEDADKRALRREVDERSARIKWIQSKIDEVDQLSKQVQAAIILRQKAISDRRQEISRAESQDELDRSAAERLLGSVHTAQDNRAKLMPLIHHYRAHHVQTLDALFPILPLSPSILLYGILAVPLPIPSGKDPAPPTILPPATLPEGVKVDERTTAAALGYVAMVVQILGNLGGTGPGPGGLVYPITCAGSRSLVRDVVSVMQGPRSFPLYTKGVERYRFDYAVFLLNTNIELLMQEANIRLLDRRHTLPNLKSLLLTLSSPTSLPPSTAYRFGMTSNGSQSGTTTYNNSRIGSRQTSYAYPAGSPSAYKAASSFHSSPAGSGRGGLGRENGMQSLSPMKGWEGGKRSQLSRQSYAGSEEGEEESVISRSEIL